MFLTPGKGENDFISMAPTLLLYSLSIVPPIIILWQFNNDVVAKRPNRIGYFLMTLTYWRFYLIWICLSTPPPPPNLYKPLPLCISQISQIASITHPAYHIIFFSSNLGIAALISCPAEVTLVRISNDQTLPAEMRRNYKGVGDAFSRILKEEGKEKNQILWKIQNY